MEIIKLLLQKSVSSHQPLLKKLFSLVISGALSTQLQFLKHSCCPVPHQCTGVFPLTGVSHSGMGALDFTSKGGFIMEGAFLRGRKTVIYNIQKYSFVKGSICFLDGNWFCHSGPKRDFVSPKPQSPACALAESRSASQHSHNFVFKEAFRFLKNFEALFCPVKCLVK